VIAIAVMTAGIGLGTIVTGGRSAWGRLERLAWRGCGSGGPRELRRGHSGPLGGRGRRVVDPTDADLLVAARGQRGAIAERAIRFAASKVS
jgi:hypothetical protein